MQNYSVFSNTGGLKRQSRFLGVRQTHESRTERICPKLAKKGVCKAFATEQVLRQTLLKEKKKQLLARATELCDLQQEMMAASSDGATAASAEMLPAVRSKMIEQLVEELKKEKEYENWNLEVELERRMQGERKKRCYFSHRAVITKQTARDDVRAAQSHKKLTEAVEKRMKTMHVSSVTPAQTQLHRKQVSSKMPDTALAAAAKRRRSAFHSMAPAQKIIALMMRQRTVAVPQKLVRDVELMLRERIEQSRETARGSGAPITDDCDEDVHVDPDELEAEAMRLIHMRLYDPPAGLVDLSCLPKLLPHVGANAKSLISKDTFQYFGLARPVPQERQELPQPSRAELGPLLAALRSVDEKSFDLSRPQAVQELFEVIRVMLTWESEESLAAQGCCNTAAPQAQLRGLSLRRCNIVSGEALVAAMRKHNVHLSLMMLDLSDNKLDSLHLLFLLRANFSERLLRLSLKNNPITRKPEYREQVRRMLPRLLALDGEPIRRPPLALPHPTSCATNSLAYRNAAGLGAASPALNSITAEETQKVLDAVDRLFYIWETRRVPLQEEEIKFERRGGPVPNADGSADDLRPEEDADYDHFAKLYFHPAATLSLTVHGDCHLFDEGTMKSSVEAGMDESFTGLRLAPLDVKDLRVFDVSVRNSNRNLLLGRPVLQRFARGPLQCYAMYQSTLYPDRFEVCHHLGHALVSVHKIEDPHSRPSACAASRPSAAEGGRSLVVTRGDHSDAHKRKRCTTESGATAPVSASPTLFGAEKRLFKPTFFIVTLHGLMTWRVPSMRGDACVLAAYNRVLTFVESTAPTVASILERLERARALKRSRKEGSRMAKKTEASDGGAAKTGPVVQLLSAAAQLQEEEEEYNTNLWLALRQPSLLLYNDQTTLRPARVGDLAYCSGRADRRLLRLLITFGLECCPDGVRLVKAVVERTTSDAAAHAALNELIFGQPVEKQAASDTVASQHPPQAPSATKMQKPRKRVTTGTAPARDAAPYTEVMSKIHFDIESALTLSSAAADASEKAAAASHIHLTLWQVVEVTRRANTYHTVMFDATAQAESCSPRAH